MQQREFFGPAVIRFAPLIIFVVAAAIYANTVGHGFVLDDEIVITKNILVQEGFSGLPKIFSEDSFYGYFNQSGKSSLIAGGRYRPLSIALFAVVHELTGPSALAFHALALVLYGLTCIAVYYAIQAMLNARFDSNTWSTALLVAAIFTTHPIHTEVVANIKGLDETLALGFALLALILTVKGIDGGKITLTLGGAVSLFLACLGKENAVAFAAVIPVVLIVSRKHPLMSALRASAPALTAAFVYIVVRTGIVGTGGNSSNPAQSMEYMNNPFLVYANGLWEPMPISDRASLLFSSFAQYAKLLVAPYPLTHDYYPNTIVVKGMNSAGPLSGLVVSLGTLAAAAYGLVRSKQWSIGLIAFVVSFSIISNVVFPIGTIMGERFLFMPSFGIALALAAFIPGYSNRVSFKALTALTCIVCSVFSCLTIARNAAWKDNSTLFFTDIKTSSSSAKLNSACGGDYLTRALTSDDIDSIRFNAELALPYLDKAIDIHPTYGVAFYNRATCYVLLDRFEQAVRDARIALRYNGDVKKSQILLARALRDYGRFLGEKQQNAIGAIAQLLESWRLNPNDAETAHLMGIAHGISGRHSEALMWFEHAARLQPNDAQYLRDLGTAYSMVGNFQKRDELYTLASKRGLPGR